MLLPGGASDGESVSQSVSQVLAEFAYSQNSQGKHTAPAPASSERT